VRTRGTTSRFWLVLSTLNIIALVYPIVLIRGADSVDAHLLATFVLIAMIFLLVVADTVSILVADAISGPAHDNKQTNSSRLKADDARSVLNSRIHRH
jgi:hypothetical protein